MPNYFEVRSLRGTLTSEFLSSVSDAMQAVDADVRWQETWTTTNGSVCTTDQHITAGCAAALRIVGAGNTRSALYGEAAALGVGGISMSFVTRCFQKVYPRPPTRWTATKHSESC